jgi:hypothetical protein
MEDKRDVVRVRGEPSAKTTESGKEPGASVRERARRKPLMADLIEAHDDTCAFRQPKSPVHSCSHYTHHYFN